MRDNISARMLDNEPALMETKWFDYRFIHPMMATAYFSHCYVEEYKRAYKHYFDSLENSFWQLRRCENVFQAHGQHITGFHRARLFADALGIPYKHYCRLVIENCMRRGWKNLPQPTQMYDDWTMENVLNAWQEYTSSYLVLATDPRFLLERDKGSPIQKAHRVWTLEQIAKRPNPRPLLERVLIERPMVYREEAEARFGAEIVQSVFE